MARGSQFAALAGRTRTLIEDPNDIARKREGERRIGKRSDPLWKLFGFYLRRDTHNAADTILTVRNDGTDLSDVIETLLSDWVEQQPEYALLKAARTAPQPATEEETKDDE